MAGQLVKGHEFAATKSEALRKEEKANPECDVPGKHWIVVSAKEVIYRIKPPENRRLYSVLVCMGKAAVLCPPPRCYFSAGLASGSGSIRSSIWHSRTWAKGFSS